MTVRVAHQPTLDPLEEAETRLLAFCGVLLGGDGCGAGLLRKRVDGRYHTAGCPVGQFYRPEDRLTGGSPCSDRCNSAREAITAYEVWSQARREAL